MNSGKGCMELIKAKSRTFPDKFHVSCMASLVLNLTPDLKTLTLARVRSEWEKLGIIKAKGTLFVQYSTSQSPIIGWTIEVKT